MEKLKNSKFFSLRIDSFIIEK